MIEGLAASLSAEATRANERRALVLAGAGDGAAEAARATLSGAEISPDGCTVVGPVDAVPGESLSLGSAGDLLGETRSAVVLDCRETFRPNALGRVVGAVDGGGLLVLLTPPLSGWGDSPDGFDEWLAVAPFSEADVTGRIRERLGALARAHPGVAVVDCEAGVIERDGLTDPAPRLARSSPAIPADHLFPAAVYRACVTPDQVEALAAFEQLHDQSPSAVVLEADRGRGKSSAAGLASAARAARGDDVLVTAPTYRNAGELLERARETLAELDEAATIDDEPPHRLESGGSIEFVSPETAVDRAQSADLLVVDEAAGLPVARLEGCLDAPEVAFVTTVHGYEGAGRGFSVRFRDRLAGADHAVSEVAMTEPIRYAETDPVEPWAFRSLLLGASPAVQPLVAAATPASVTYEVLSPEDLLADEHLLREAFGLLVLAHYRTEPDDLARLLDAPNVAARALVHDGHVASVALIALEGDLSADRRAAMYEGGRVRGNMIPDLLTTQLRDEPAGEAVGYRILRIATHPSVRNRGLGSRLLGDIRREVGEAVDWLGVSFGATPRLVEFWADNGFRPVHCSTTRSAESGEYSAVMLDPCSAAGEALLERHADWFLDRFVPVLGDGLDDLDPAVAVAVFRAASARPALDLSAQEWRLAAGVVGGAATVDTDPRPIRELVVCHLVSPANVDALSARMERVLVARVLQARTWEAVAESHGFVSVAECARAVGRAVGHLVELYGPDPALAELERLR